MMGTTTASNSLSSSSSSSSVSITSFDHDHDHDHISVKSRTLKFVCGYGGKILLRYPDGKLRYTGGVTRVLSVHRSVTFSELVAKMGELCGWGAVSLRCQMPTEDMDALVSVTSDEDLSNLVEEYALAGREKIRAFLHPSSFSKSLISKGTKTTTSRPVAPKHQRCCVHNFSPHATFSVYRNPRYYHHYPIQQ